MPKVLKGLIFGGLFIVLLLASAFLAGGDGPTIVFGDGGERPQPVAQSMFGG